MGTRRSRSRCGDEKTRGVPPRPHRAEDDLPVPLAARRGRRADSARDRRKMFRCRRLQTEGAESVLARGRRLPPLSGGQSDHRRALHVGLDFRRAQCRNVIAAMAKTARKRQAKPKTKATSKSKAASKTKS